ncbi:putative metallodependent hydrolase [Salmonella enterica subsp. enterica serovar Daytona]|uniref:Putative metallodependent hydrolase n=1 Tax=Salmonella enterica subsp. enterica serovar Daytona TaxID=1962639 RepID=A0A447JJG0_SALET|nr:putative metallodependent hydrolase [Salmonella enterica subsp. enterica serovar Daytona]
MFLVDSHCHLDGLDYQSLHKDVDDVLAKAAARDVKFCLAVATTLPGVSPYARAGGQAR